MESNLPKYPQEDAPVMNKLDFTYSIPCYPAGIELILGNIDFDKTIKATF